MMQCLEANLIVLDEMPDPFEPRAPEFRSDHDLLIELRVLMNRMIADVDDMRTDTVAAGKDIEHRVRSLEGFRWWILGASSAVSFISGALGAFVFHK